MSVVYYVQHSPQHRHFEVVRWENVEGKIKKLIVQTSIYTRDKAETALEFWRQNERNKGNGKTS